MDQSKSFERRNELIAAALKEFSVRAYEAASINRIISEAGISKGTFYYHFPSKEELFFFLVDHAVQSRIDFVTARMTALGPEGAGKDLFEQLKIQAKIGVDFALGCPQLVQFAVRAAREQGPISTKLLERLGGRTASLLEPLLAGAIAKGEVRADLGSDFPAVILPFMFLSFNQLFVDPHKSPNRDQIYADLDRYFEFIKHGLAGQQ